MPLTILTVGTLGMGSAIVTSVERHSVGMELIILIRKNLFFEVDK